MLVFLLAKASERSLRLFFCACVRLLGIGWMMYQRPLRQWLVEMAEGFADGRRSLEEARAFVEDWYKVISVTSHLESNLVHQTATWCVSPEIDVLDISRSDAWRAELTRVRRNQVRAIASISIPGSLRTPLPCGDLRHQLAASTAVALAIAVQTRASSPRCQSWPMPCKTPAATAQILDHCRDTGPHVRGCWVVDLVLGKN